MSILKFQETVTKVKLLNEEAANIIENFKVSTGELTECFKWILHSELVDNSHHCCLTLSSCSADKANQLIEMGFKVDEMRNDFNTLCGYDISW